MRKTIYIASTIMLLISSSVLARKWDYHVFDEINNSFGVGINVLHANYREDANGAVASVPGTVEDYGNVYGVYLDVKNIFYNFIYTNLSGDYATGKLQYDGYNKVTLEPLKNKKSSDFINIDGKLGLVLLDTGYFQVVPYLGGGFYYWKLGNNFVSYYNYKGLVGARVNFALFDDMVISPYFNFGKTFMPRVKDGATGTKLNLGKKPITEVGVELNYRWADEFFLTGFVSHSSFSYGTAETDHLIEPNSTTNNLRFGLGMRIIF